jgi:hypothetical protein
LRDRRPARVPATRPQYPQDRYIRSKPRQAAAAPVREIMGWRIDEATMRDIDEILAATITRPVGPEFMAPPVALDA